MVRPYRLQAALRGPRPTEAEETTPSMGATLTLSLHKGADQPTRSTGSQITIYYQMGCECWGSQMVAAPPVVDPSWTNPWGAVTLGTSWLSGRAYHVCTPRLSLHAPLSPMASNTLPLPTHW
jgi:hypothetical protein